MRWMGASVGILSGDNQLFPPRMNRLRTVWEPSAGAVSERRGLGRGQGDPGKGGVRWQACILKQSSDN